MYVSINVISADCAYVRISEDLIELTILYLQLEGTVKRFRFRNSDCYFT